MTDENIEAILRHVSLGIWPDRAAQLVGIDPAAMRKHKERNAEFVTALEKAEAEAEASLHGRMLRAMDDNWTAVAWMLERRFRDRYAKNEPKLIVNNEAHAQSAALASGPQMPNPQDFAAQLQQAAQIASEVLSVDHEDEPSGS
tara:strand:- start:862 stop:1293 length:432 start_codon:yes stop_codon:yes gene_type:complete